MDVLVIEPMRMIVGADLVVRGSQIRVGGLVAHSTGARVGKERERDC